MGIRPSDPDQFNIFLLNLGFYFFGASPLVFWPTIMPRDETQTVRHLAAPKQHHRCQSSRLATNHEIIDSHRSNNLLDPIHDQIGMCSGVSKGVGSCSASTTCGLLYRLSRALDLRGDETRGERVRSVPRRRRHLSPSIFDPAARQHRRNDHGLSAGSGVGIRVQCGRRQALDRDDRRRRILAGRYRSHRRELLLGATGPGHPAVARV